MTGLPCNTTHHARTHQPAARLPTLRACPAQSAKIAKVRSQPASMLSLLPRARTQTSAAAHSRGGRSSGQTYLGSPGLSHFLTALARSAVMTLECPIAVGSCPRNQLAIQTAAAECKGHCYRAAIRPSNQRRTEQPPGDKRRTERTRHSRRSHYRKRLAGSKHGDDTGHALLPCSQTFHRWPTLPLRRDQTKRVS
jgi:hypothetical protein